MRLREWLRSGRLQYLTLWALSLLCVGSALAGVSLFGLEPVMLATVAAVFAAGTSAYKERTNCQTTP